VGESAIVQNFEKSLREEVKPIPFNTTEFLREASKFMRPDRAMNIAETLYMNGYISYPRTDNTVYPKTVNIVSIAEMFLSSEFAEEAKIVLMQERIIPSRGKSETKDHPPIYPTGIANRKDLSADEWKIYELIVRRFLATLAPNAVWEIKKAELDSNGVKFVAAGKKLIQEGWRKIYTYSKVEETSLPDLREEEKLKIVEKILEEKETKPPARFSPGNLIKLMEKLNLGTKSTRHEILRKLINRRYVYGNPFRPTETAFSVVEALKSVAETITLPDMTAKLERDMDMIAEGKMKEQEVFEESRKYLREILKNVDYSKLSASLKEGVRKDKMVGKCPSCGGELVVRKTKNGRRFIGCEKYPECRFTLPLPQKGALYIGKKECKEHAIREIKIRTKKGYWNIGCPYCNYLKWKEEN
jgi:DNA topoisomerase-1